MLGEKRLTIGGGLIYSGKFLRNVIQLVNIIIMKILLNLEYL